MKTLVVGHHYSAGVLPVATLNRLNPKFLGLPTRLRGHGKRRHNQYGPGCFLNNVLGPYKLHWCFTHPAICKDGGAPFLNCPIDKMFLEIEKEIRNPVGPESRVSINLQFRRQKLGVVHYFSNSLNVTELTHP